MLNETAFNSIVAAVAALLGVLFGLLLGRFVLPGPREVKRLREELDRRLHEQAEYETRVASHFRRTGELIGQMTESYKAVYDHLAQGAQTLCAAAAIPKPAFAAPRLVVDQDVSIGDDGSKAGDAALKAERPAASPDTEAPRASGDTPSVGGIDAATEPSASRSA